MSRLEFKNNLKKHDWYHGYSDDHRSWTKGQSELKVLRLQHEEFECPFSIAMLQKWAHNMIVEEFVEEAPNNWYRHPKIYDNIASSLREELITQEEFDKIAEWLES